jgi:uncharacterized protein YndB with AHSA1/START domain
LPIDDLRLHLDTVLNASRTRVFEALVEPHELTQWWGPAGFTSPSVDFEPRVGRAYRIEMQPPEGEAFHLRGEFLEVDPPSRLAYTFIWEDPDPDDQETLVRLTLEDLGEKTKLTLDQGPFATDGRLELHRDGWSDSFERLRKAISSAS